MYGFLLVCWTYTSNYCQGVRLKAKYTSGLLIYKISSLLSVVLLQQSIALQFLLQLPFRRFFGQGLTPVGNIIFTLQALSQWPNLHTLRKSRPCDFGIPDVASYVQENIGSKQWTSLSSSFKPHTTFFFSLVMIVFGTVSGMITEHLLK